MQSFEIVIHFTQRSVQLRSQRLSFRLIRLKALRFEEMNFVHHCIGGDPTQVASAKTRTEKRAELSQFHIVDVTRGGTLEDK